VSGATSRQEAVAGSQAERDARLRLLTAQLPAVVWCTDMDLRITSCAGAALRGLGLEPEQLIGVTMQEWLGASDPGSPKIAAHLAALDGESQRYDTHWGDRRYEGYVEPLRDDAGAIIGTVGVALDVTEREHAERERALLQAKLRHQQRLEAIGTLASGVAHEINNPVQSIMNYAQLIRRRGGGEEIETYAGEILHEAQRVAAIVRNLRSFARQEGEPYAEMKLSEIVNSTLALIAVMLRKEGIELRVDVPEDTPPVRCHPQQIQQVLMNLLTNARDALNERYPSRGEVEERDPRKAIEIRVGPTREGFARLTVEDFGTGIALDMLDRIFDPFRTTRSQRPGAGVGLSISLAIVREHGGTLIVESEQGVFTRVHLDLPLAGVAAADT
jgi:PAS domain S-box-containing protein